MKRLAFVLTMLLAGCSPLAPRPDASRYYVLTPPSAPDPPPGKSAAVVIIGLGPVALPSYLARPEVATRVGPNQISYSPVARWAAPLHSTIAQVLADTVEAELGAAEVIPFPSFGAARLDYVVEIGLRRFECDGDGAATLAAVCGRSATRTAARCSSHGPLPCPSPLARPARPPRWPHSAGHSGTSPARSPTESAGQEPALATDRSSGRARPWRGSPRRPGLASAGAHNQIRLTRPGGQRGSVTGTLQFGECVASAGAVP